MIIKKSTLNQFAKSIKAIDAALFGMVKDSYEYHQAQTARKALIYIIGVQGYELNLDYRLVRNWNIEEQ